MIHHIRSRRSRGRRREPAGRGRLLGRTMLAAAIALAPGLVGAGPAAAASGSTLTLAADTQISTFNPFLSYFDGELDILGCIYPTLTMIDEHGKPQPYLATKWKPSSDGLTWTFTIRSGLKWSDGKPLTAHDAAWTFNLIMHNDVAATSNGSLVDNFAKVTAPNDTTLVIKTKQPQANMLYLSVPVTGIPIVPEHVWKSEVKGLKNFKNMNFPVVGYGPWILTGYVKNQYATLKANKDFILGPPKFDTLISRYFSNSDASVAALRTGELTWDGLTATQYNGLKNAKNIETYQSAASGWTAVEINSGAKTRSGKKIGTGNPILADKRVRKAIAYAIDRKTLVRKVLDGLGQPGAGYLPPGYPQWWWKPSKSEEISYDPNKANQILDQAGYKKGSNGIRRDPQSGKPLSFRLGIHSDSTSDAQIAPYLKEWLKAVGINLTVQSMSFTQLNANLAKGDWDMLMDGWGTGADPTYLLSIQTCATLPLNNGSAGNTDAFYCNHRYDKLFKKQTTQFNTAQRAATIRSMEKILYEANTDIILYYQNGLAAYRTDKMSNYTFGSPNGQNFYPLQNLFINWRTATPTSGGGSSNAGMWAGIGAGIAVVVAVPVALFARRRAQTADRE